MSSQQQVIPEVLTFHIGDFVIGVEISRIEQVMLLRDNVVELPRTPKFILGAISDGDRLIPLVDLATFLDLRPPKEEFGLTSNAILVTMDQFVYGLYSDDIPQKLEEIPVNPQGEVPEQIPKPWIQSTLDMDGQSIYLINPDQLWQSLQ
ncbi:MAG: chemotaxis protein CheW [Methanobacteriota archaeon]|nr:MAG: chemotaxis protein CheW [Euryarchaeota archaeon]